MQQDLRQSPLTYTREHLQEMMLTRPILIHLNVPNYAEMFVVNWSNNISDIKQLKQGIIAQI